MNIQLVFVGLTALLAAGYLARQAWRTWTSKGCSGGCCKNAAPKQTKPLISSDDLFERMRQRSR